MAMSFTPAQLERFRREAKKLSRQLPITHTAALNSLAVKSGFANWSLLAKHSGGIALPARPAQAAGPDRPRDVRYNLHGDVLEADPTKCFCSRCDSIVPIEHLLPVSEHADGKDGERYLRDLALWNERSAELRRFKVRPEDAPNILAAGAVAARDAREAARSPFHRWLDEQRHRSDPVGDLAGDILRDRGFPVTLATRRDLEDHLAIYGSHVIKALRQAWREFKGGERAEWTLAHALAGELRITPEEAQELVCAEAVELTDHSGGTVHGYEFDFTDHASPKLAAKLLRRRRSLKIQVGPWIYDGIGDSDSGLPR